ncbi:MAG: hypothetical protein P8Y58_16360, partial [Novosphingobium sp.]
TVMEQKKNKRPARTLLEQIRVFHKLSTARTTGSGPWFERNGHDCTCRLPLRAGRAGFRLGLGRDLAALRFERTGAAGTACGLPGKHRDFVEIK